MLSIIIPCYNEADNLVALFNSLDPVYNTYNDLEIILVDNGSSDNSAKVFEVELKKRNINVFKIINVEKNIGYGFGILSGLRNANGDILAITHADRQTDPMDVLKALDIYNKHKNELLLVKGYRKNRKITEAFFSWTMALISSMALGKRLTEINAQPKLFSKRFFLSIEKNAPYDFSLDLYLLYHAKQKGIILDFPVYFAKRVAGEAKGGSGSSWATRKKLIKRTLKYIFELRKKIKD
jgi:glycosyltransferase involved in cell wall biosynthesis